VMPHGTSTSWFEGPFLESPAKRNTDDSKEKRQPSH